MGSLTVSLACGDYDRTRALQDGTVECEGLDIQYMRAGPSDVFWRMIKYQEFDVSEMSLSAHIMGSARGDWPFVAIPVFPSRVFRHGYIFIHERSGIEKPEDLKGKRVGVPEYHMTAALFIRGLLSDEYGVRAEDIHWVQGGQYQAGREERVQLDLDDSIQLTVERERTIDELLLEGEVDATLGAYIPQSFARGVPGVRRLFLDPRSADLAYYQRTGIFPIMHVIAIRRELYEQHPWIARSLFNGFEEAKSIAYREMLKGQNVMLPLFGYDIEEAKSVFGKDFWPYGVERNRTTLDAATRYSHEQQLSKHRVMVTDLFTHTTLEDSAV